MKKLDGETEDIEFYLLLNKFLANLKDGHAYVFYFHLFNSKKRYPFILNWNGQDFFLANIDSQTDSNLIGAKVIAVNEKPIDKVIKMLSEYIPEYNSYGIKQWACSYLRVPKIMKYTGISDNIKKLRLTVITSKSNKRFY